MKTVFKFAIAIAVPVSMASLFPTWDVTSYIVGLLVMAMFGFVDLVKWWMRLVVLYRRLEGGVGGEFMINYDCKLRLCRRLLW